MKAYPSYQNHVKSEIKTIKPKTADSIDLSKLHGDRRTERKGNKSIRRYDEVVFTDLEGACDYLQYFSGCIDSEAILNIKGPFANLLYTFTHIEEGKESEDERRVLTETRPFPSKSGLDVPQFLPDLASQWQKRFPNVDKHFRADDYASEIESIIKTSPEMRPICAESSKQSNWVLLGLRAYKTSNVNKSIFNLLTAMPQNQICAADFHEDARSLIVYNYARTVKKNEARSLDDKAEVEEFMKTMPERPEGKKSDGFPKGTAEQLFKQLRGEQHVHVLERVKSKFKDVRLTEKSSYSETQTLQTDQEVLDSLPTLEYFTSVSNSTNVGQGHMNRLANIAFGYNDADSAEKVLRLLLEKDLRDAYVKAAEDARRTPEQIAAREQKKKAAAEKRAATRLKNKELKAKEAANQPQVVGPIVQAPPLPVAADTVPVQEQGADDNDSEDLDDSSNENDSHLMDIWHAQSPQGQQELKQNKRNNKKYVKVSKTKLQKKMIKQVRALADERRVSNSIKINDDSNHLALLRKAHVSFDKNGYVKLNVLIETVVPLGSLVCLKTSSDHVTQESIALVLSEDSKNQRHRAFHVLVFDSNTNTTRSVSVNCKDVYLLALRK